MRKIYLAGRYEWKEELKVIRDQVHSTNHQVISSWIDTEEPAFGDYVIWADKYATTDLTDISQCDTLILFLTNPMTGELSNGGRGGHLFEFGISYATGKDIYIVGAKNSHCIFAFLNKHGLTRFDYWSECLEQLKSKRLSGIEQSIFEKARG